MVRRLPAGLALVDEGAIRMAPLLVLPQLLTERGLDPGRVIGESGSDLRCFDDPDKTIAFPALGRLLAHAVSATGCSHLGLEIGRRNGLEALGAIGAMARVAPTLGSALRAIILYLHLHDRGAVPALWHHGDRSLLGYAIHWSDVPGTDQIYDAAVAIMLNIVTSLVGPAWTPSEVWLPRDRPAEVAPYRAHFRVRLHFSAPHAAIVFPSADLARPLRSANALAFSRAIGDLEAFETLAGTTFDERVRRLLRRLLIAGAGPDEVGLEQVARLFTIHRRTLNRRLQDQGTSFQALLGQTRYEIACQLLRDTRLATREVASALGYADVTAFSRAFRCWSGSPPAAWRSAHQPD